MEVVDGVWKLLVMCSSSSSLRACSPDGWDAHTGSGLAPQNVLRWLNYSRL